MTTLRQRVYESIKAHPRDITDMVRSIALFIPNEHHLAKVAASYLESLKYSPPESHVCVLMEFLRSFHAAFPDSQVLTGPWWVRVICVLTTGGSPESEDLITNLGRHYIQGAEARPSLN